VKRKIDSSYSAKCQCPSGKEKMKRISKKTKNCVRCFKPAVNWTGHIIKGKERIFAGWCDSCWIGVKEASHVEGFSGHYRREMGIRHLK